MIYLFEMIFATFTKGYLNSENEDIPVFRGIGVMVIIQIGVIMVLQELINNQTCIIQRIFGDNDFLLILGEIAFFFIFNIFYFNGKRIAFILGKHDQMSDLKKGLILLVGLILLIAPIILYIQLPNNCTKLPPIGAGLIKL